MALLDELGRAFDDDPTLVAALDAVRSTARRHAELVDRAHLPGDEPGALAHRQRLTELAAELRSLHDRLARAEEADLSEAL